MAGILQLYEFIGISESDFNYRKIENTLDIESEVIKWFDEDQTVFKSFLYAVFDKRIKSCLYNQKELKKDTRIDSIIPKNKLIRWIEEIESCSKLILPNPELSTLRLILKILILTLPFLGIFYFAITHLEFLFVLYGVVTLGLFILIGFIPYTIVILMFPMLLMPSEFSKILTYEDLLREIVLINRTAFVDNNFLLTRIELKKILEQEDDLPI